jgi:uncharacterized membrane protein
MKKLYAVMVVALLLGGIGCDSKSTPGGPGATNPNGPALTTPENAFELDPPKTETNLKQGETKTITVSISRGKKFDQDVKLDFSGAPKGVKVTAASPEIKANIKDVQVTIEAAKDATLGEHTITVNGTPAKEGPKASKTFKIQVDEAK